ncbi:MAG: peptidoglycan-binding protein [Ruminococcus sp.]|nr:peptidoglycan-binding protein [Ruminococcus sp.]
MAYTNAQRRQHIYELQTYLHAISLMNDSIPQVIPSGVYDSDTSAAVRAFQREYGLPETGSTDPVTWNRIVGVYRSMLSAQPVPYAVFPSPGYVAKPGDTGQVIYVVQVMLCCIGRRYDNMQQPEICGSFTEETAAAVRQFQQWCGLPQNGRVDSATWNMLVSCCEHLCNE